MIVLAAPLSCTVRPNTFGSDPNRRCHRDWLITATRKRPGRVSSSVNMRPSKGFTRNKEKKSGVTSPTGMSSVLLPASKNMFPP
jgi:hypothetical protein